MSKDQTLYFSAEHDQKLVEHEDGTFSMTSGATTFRIDNEGNVLGDLSHIRTVGVRDIVNLTDYRLTKENGVIRHSLKFRRGGSLEFAYTEEGELREFSGHDLKIKISKENEVMIEGESKE